MAIVPDFQSDLTNHFFKGFKISSHFIDDKAKEIHFYLEPCSEFPVCPRCKGKNVVVHEYRKRIVQDDSILGYKTVLFITYRTFKCKFCDKYATEQIPFISSRHRITKSLENEVIEDLQRSGSIKDTAQRTSIK